MNRKIPLPLFALLTAALLVTAASFSGVTGQYVVKNNGVATNLWTYGTATNDALQVNGAATVSGAFSGSAVTASTAFYASNLNPNTALYANGARAILSSSTTATELGYVSGVTSPIQTQLNAIAPGNFIARSNGVGTNIFTYGIATNSALTVVGPVTVTNVTFTTGAMILSGTNAPEGLVTAPGGSLYLVSASGGANGQLFVKQTGTGNTGWIMK